MVSLALFVLILADAAFVVHFYAWSGGRNNATSTIIARAIAKRLGMGKIPQIDLTYPWASFFVREADAYRDLDTPSSSADELTQLLGARSQDLVEVKRQRFVGRVGWWAPTVHKTEHRLRIRRMSDGSTPDDEALVRAAYANTFFGKRDPERDRLATGDIVVHRVLWSGYLHNAAILLLLALFILSLAWAPRLWGEGRRRRLLARDLCPRCLYDLSGTVASAGAKACPECGRTWILPTCTPP